MEIELLQSLAVATGIGLLVGVERGWRERKAGAGMRTAGIRTFTLSGMLGGIFGAIAEVLGDPVGGGIVLAIGFVTFAAIFATYRLREIEHDKTFGATTVIAALATFAAGAYAVVGDEVAAAAIGVAIVIVLAAREATHDWLKRITWPELRAAIVLAAMTFLALPVIPDESYGPFGGVNFRQVWLLAVILAAVSFVGYAAVKRFGAGQGLLVASAAGGLVSSTAVNVMLARRAAAGEAHVRLLAASSIVASGVSHLRTAGLIIFLNPAVALYAVGPLLVAAAAATAIAYWFGRDQLSARAKSAFTLRNPFSLREVLALAALLAVVKFGTGAASEFFGLAGALVAAVIAGLADTDSITYSMAELGRGALASPVAAVGVLLAVAANTAFKIGSGWALGGSAFGLPLALGLAVPVLAGAALVPFLLV
ncbi:MAG: MgtC/SapB family protein [Bradyrhizobiaceae bacterium]|nr:MgtC/SapB family protein [Bradyrhizobiaceae bacterium]